MRRLLLGLLALSLTAVLAPISTAGAKDSTGPCIAGTSGPKCQFWTAKVAFIADGDTIRVQVDGHHTKAPVTIRFTGINAMELHRYSKYPDRRVGECHGLEATALIERYIKRSHGVVRLSAQHASSSTGGRLHRWVAVRVGRSWKDLGRIEMEQGQALWLPNGTEYAHNLEYHQLAEQAAAAQRNLYNPSACGVGPNQDAQVKMTVNWDADGNDYANVNGEWVDLHNVGSTDLPLGGWWFRDSFLRYNANGKPGFEFPSDAVLPAGGTIRLYMGCGPNTPTEYHWCQSSSVFENASYDAAHMGDGGYLFDPQGDLRFSMMYPCVLQCGDPLIGKVKISAHPSTPESISVQNVSGSPVDLQGHILKLHLAGARDKFIFGYPFGPDAQLGPGETLRLWLDGSPSNDSRLVKYVGRGPYVLADGGNTISLRSFTDVVIDCFAWGTAHC